jgi:hypothetical protein
MKERQFAVNTQNVVAEVIEGEAILINMTTGCYYSLEGTACQIWQWLHEAPAGPQNLSIRFEGDAAEILPELTAFLNELHDEKLISREMHATEGAVPSGVQIPYAKLTLNKYTDMENLLLMDPIHDVSGQGWPAKLNDGE